MATCSGILAWEIPWTEEPGGPQSVELQSQTRLSEHEPPFMVTAQNCSGLERHSSLVAQRLKRLPGMWETQVQSLSWEDPLEKAMATHSSTPAWRIPWTEEPGGLQSMGLQRVGHD